MINNIKMARVDIAMLITRIIIGGIFIFAGWQKVTNMSDTIGFFSSLNIPTFLTYIVSYGELIGGILILLGLWTALAGAFLSIIMIVAICIVAPQGITNAMTPLATLAGTVSIIGCGSGKYRVPSSRFN